jgi:ribulose-bisphosphate carboxylase large chain
VTPSGPVVRATFDLEPAGSAQALAIEESVGMEVSGDGPNHVRGRVVSESAGRAVLEFPASNWGRNIALLISSLVAGEAVETGGFSRCRLTDLQLPDGLLPGPAFGAVPGRSKTPSIAVGVIVKPSLGLNPAQVAAVARAAVAGGADFIKDDEILGDPPWCPLEARVEAVGRELAPGVVYCPNITGASATLLDRARRVVDLGATGVMVNGFAQGLEAVLSLRDAGLGVPILAHRAGSGPYTRNERFGARGAVLCRLTRLCGADYVIVGAFGGKLFETDQEVRDNLAAARDRCGQAPPSVALFGGGLGPDNAADQIVRAGGSGLLILLGSRAYRHPGGIEAGVRATVAAVRAAVDQ